MNKDEEIMILWSECKEVFLNSCNEQLPELLNNILEIVRKNYDVFLEKADLDFLNYMINVDVDEYIIGTNGDDFELRLRSLARTNNISVESIWQMLSQLAWDLMVVVTVKVCPFCKCDNLILLMDKEKKHIYESCENCFWVSEKGIQIKRPDELFPINKDILQKGNYIKYINKNNL